MEVLPEQAQPQRTIHGFGGCFNELGWEALRTLASARRTEVLRALFDPQDGCGFTLCRVPIGASDYATDWYSHNDHVGDLEMAHFTIDRDRVRLIPYIRAALHVQPALRLWASPWSPPAWMKTNNHYACEPCPGRNDLAAAGRGEEMVTQFRMEPAYLDAYALYLLKFAKAYRGEGINLVAVHPQNEPNSCQAFPSCVWTPGALASFIGKHLGPLFEKEEVGVEIWLGTVERPHPERIRPILDDPYCRRFIRGVGFQWAGRGAVHHVAEAYPELPLMQTENECGRGENDWEAAVRTFSHITEYLSSGAGAYMYWNMVLDETGRSSWGWPQNAMISVDRNRGSVRYNPEFYVMKHLSHFIRQGAVRLRTSGTAPLALAFRNLDHSTVVLFYHDGPRKQCAIRVHGRALAAQIGPRSLHTVVIPSDGRERTT